jgi:multidrug efflux pump subunit AcrB
LKRIIAATTNHRVFANLLMAVLILLGVISLYQIKSEIIPSFSLDMVSVTVAWKGASPEEVEEGVCIKVEEAIAGITGIKKISSTANENNCSLIAELESWVDDARTVMDDIKNAVDRIDTFPDEIERPVISEVKRIDQVLNLALYGDAPETALKRMAEEIKEELIALPGVSQVAINGVRNWEISIEVSEATLRRHGLTFERLAETIRKNVLELTGGDIRSSDRRIRIRTVGKRYTGPEFENLEMLTRADGTILRLRDIARVVDGFEDTDKSGRFNGKNAALIIINKTEDEDALQIADKVNAYAARKQKTLPAGISLTPWANTSRLILDRLNLLLRNGRIGLVLVFLSLWLFLNIRLSFWVTVGIPVSLLASLGFVTFVGGSLNMITMFAFIMVLGILVDDAIVVAENIYARMQTGEDFFEAAIGGAAEVAWPVVGTVTTTIVAFMPLFWVEGTLGKFMAILPVVIIAALVASLVESLFILPTHLAHWVRPPREKSVSGRIRARIEGFVTWWIGRVYLPFLRFCLEARYLVIAVALVLFSVTIGLTMGGHVRFLFFPGFDSDFIQAKVLFPEGTPIGQTSRAARRIEGAVRSLEKEFRSKSGEPIIQNDFAILGEQVSRPNKSEAEGSNAAQVIVELLPAERRGIPSSEIVSRWREKVGAIPDALSLTFGGSQVHPGGKPIEIRFTGPGTADLRRAAEALKIELRKYPGVQEIEDDFRPGKLELRAELKPQARVLGVSLQDLAFQLRSRFFGLEALRIQRGRDDVKVKVRYPPEERRTLGNVESARIRTPSGAEIPFYDVADVGISRGLAEIKRIDRSRVITVTAEVDEAIANSAEIIASLGKGFFPGLMRRLPGVRVRFEGQAKDRKESVGSLMRGYAFAGAVIFLILATLFRSYFQPIVVMSAIPFGVVGAVWGHIFMGFDISMMSLMGIVALSGVVVNDSLVFLDFANRFIARGMKIEEALTRAGASRLRPIVLTSLTTVAGLGPMLLERSFQAQFLIPMAVSLCFGLVFATVITLVLVPVFSLIGNDIVRLWQRLWSGRWPSREEADVHHPQSGPEAHIADLPDSA